MNISKKRNKLNEHEQDYQFSVIDLALFIYVSILKIHFISHQKQVLIHFVFAPKTFQNWKVMMNLLILTRFINFLMGIFLMYLFGLFYIILKTYAILCVEMNFRGHRVLFPDCTVQKKWRHASVSAPPLLRNQSCSAQTPRLYL